MQQGSATLEIIIALVVGSVLMLTIAAKQMGVFQAVSDAYYRHVAHDEVVYAAHHWQHEGSGFVSQWQREVARALPAGHASIVQDHGDVMFSVRWQQRDHAQQQVQFQYRVRQA